MDETTFEEDVPEVSEVDSPVSDTTVNISEPEAVEPITIENDISSNEDIIILLKNQQILLSDIYSLIHDAYWTFIGLAIGLVCFSIFYREAMKW